MQALRVHGFEGRERWRLEAIPAPRPGVGEVQVRIAATAISYVDLLFARGGYQIRPPLPLVPGTEFAGVITACGPGVGAPLAVGQPVTGTVFGGAWAEYACAPAHAVVPLPVGADLRAASTLPITAATAVYALKRRAQLQCNETVLVLGAAGGVGLASVQVAKALGATVVAGTSARKLQAALDAGADHAVDTTQADWRMVLKACAPEGVDVVVDPVGGALTESAFRSLRWGGRHLVVGFAEAEIPALRTNLALLKGAALLGVDLRQFRERAPAQAQDNLADTAALFAQGLLQPRVAQVHAVADWARAMEAAAERATIGRVVLDWTRAD